MQHAVAVVLGTVQRTMLFSGMVRPGSRVLVAVSGGPDSVGLLGLLASLRRKLELELVAGHVNHRLRGVASDADESCAAAAAKQLGIDFVRADLADRLAPGANLEARARELRYRFLHELADANHAVVGEDQDRICRPFDVRRSGLVLGEGAAVVVLEERDHALERGATIHGEVAGSASVASRRGGQGEDGLSLSMKKALGDAGVSLEDVDVIHANGDSTTENDRAEWLAIRRVFGEKASHLPVVATKSLHGHLLSAAGAVELVSSLMMLERGVIPPIANYDRPDPECDLDLVQGLPRKTPGIKSVILNAVGLFGEAASLVVVR